MMPWHPPESVKLRYPKQHCAHRLRKRKWVCISLGWGFAVAFGIFTATTFGAPQGDLNPAVTLAKMLAGVYTLGQFIMTSIVQILGGIVGAVLVWLAYLPHWSHTSDPAAKLGIFATAPAIRSTAANFITEFIATFFLMFIIWMIFSDAFIGMPPGYGPYLVGILIVAFAFPWAVPRAMP